MIHSDKAVALNLWAVAVAKGNAQPLRPHRVDFDGVTKQAIDLLNEVMKFRRMVGAEGECCESTCDSCRAPHLQKVVSAILVQKPIQFVLPAFPGKSPNPAKVLGPLPDLAERRALSFLNSLCRRLKKIYQPGAEVVLCSDGRVFSDVVGMKEEHVTAYQDAIDEMIKELHLEHISTFNLDELCGGHSFDQIRTDLMNRFGQPLESLREKVRRGGKGSHVAEDIEAQRMYCGITRFLFEDSLVPGHEKSRTALQKDAKARAYEVIRRSNAWSELIAEQFPKAVRLSIHPQVCGAKKLGIQLLGESSWMTPWHGVAVDNGNEIVLMKRWEAEKLNAQIVLDSKGRASHYEL